MTHPFWDKIAQRYDDKIQDHDAVYNNTIERCRSLLTASDVVLDFACASGEMTLDLARHVQRIDGIDLSAKMIELANKKARERLMENVLFHQIDLFDQKLTAHSFSAILVFNILHLVDDAPKTLSRLHDLLTAGGLLISQTPCLAERNWGFRLGVGLAQKVGLVPTIRSFTVQGLESLISRGNFETVETKLWDKENRVQWIVARKK